MKVCCLIDSLNSGGAQRQMTWLVRALVENQHDVRLLTYYEFDHYLPDILASGVKPENVISSSKLGRLRIFRDTIRRDSPDVIISFLDTPNYLGVFSSLPPNRIPLIVSERNHDIGGVDWKNRVRFHAFRAATKVVTNCYAQSEFVSANFPFLQPKLSTILNCVDLDRFRPCLPDERTADSDSLRIVVAASIVPRKNTENLIRGVALARDRSVAVSIDWFGRRPSGKSEYYIKCMSLISELGLESVFRFHDPVRNIEEPIRASDGCCLPSLREGCPNFVCEALASGVPLLVSDHGDMKRMIDESLGFRFDPLDVGSIADSLQQFASLSVSQRATMGKNCRKFAEASLSPERFAEQYESAIHEVVH